MIMLGFGVVYIDNDDEYFCSMAPTYMNPIWMSDQSMLGIFYSNVEYVLSTYDVIWVYVVYNT